jgi:hypothetical protein
MQLKTRFLLGQVATPLPRTTSQRIPANAPDLPMKQMFIIYWLSEDIRAMLNEILRFYFRTAILKMLKEYGQQKIFFPYLKELLKSLRLKRRPTRTVMQCFSL